MDSLVPLCVALLGVVMAVSNRKWAELVMDNHRLLRGGAKSANEAKWFMLYRIIAVVAGCFFAVSGILGALGVITVRH